MKCTTVKEGGVKAIARALVLLLQMVVIPLVLPLPLHPYKASHSEPGGTQMFQRMRYLGLEEVLRNLFSQLIK